MGGLLAPLRKAPVAPADEEAPAGVGGGLAKDPARLRALADVVVAAAREKGVSLSGVAVGGPADDRAVRRLNEDVARLNRRLSVVAGLAAPAIFLVLLLCGFSVWVGITLQNAVVNVKDLQAHADVAALNWPLLYVPAPSGVVRTYYVAAQDVAWDFAPSTACCSKYPQYASTPSGCRCDLAMGGPIDPNYATVWPATRFVQYTDRHFLFQTSQPAWLGIMG